MKTKLAILEVTKRDEVASNGEEYFVVRMGLPTQDVPEDDNDLLQFWGQGGNSVHSKALFVRDGFTPEMADKAIEVGLTFPINVCTEKVAPYEIEDEDGKVREVSTYTLLLFDYELSRKEAIFERAKHPIVG